MGHRLTVQHLSGSRKGASESFTGDVIRAGRDPACEIRFHPEKDIDASATHGEIRWSGAGYKLLDLGSTNGTYLNGEKVLESPLSSGDEVEFGKGGPRLLLTIARVYRPGAGILAVAAALVLVGGLVALFLAFREKGGDPPPPPPKIHSGKEAVIAVYSRAWYTTLSSVEEVAEAWGTGILIGPDGVVLVPKHVVRPWKFDAEAAAMVEHYEERLKTLVAAWPSGVSILEDGRPDLGAAYTSENGKLQVFEAPDVFGPAAREVSFTAGGKEVTRKVTLHIHGAHDAVILRLKGAPGGYLSVAESTGPPEEVEEFRILGQRSATSVPERLEPSDSSRRILKRFEDAFELEVGPRYWSGAVVLWKERPVGIYSDILGRCHPLDSVKEALLGNPEIRQRFGGLLRPGEEEE